MSIFPSLRDSEGSNEVVPLPIPRPISASREPAVAGRRDSTASRKEFAPMAKSTFSRCPPAFEDGGGSTRRGGGGDRWARGIAFDRRPHETREASGRDGAGESKSRRERRRRMVRARGDGGAARARGDLSDRRRAGRSRGSNSAVVVVVGVAVVVGDAVVDVDVVVLTGAGGGL